MPIKSREMARLRLHEALLPLNSTVDVNLQKKERKKREKGRTYLCRLLKKLIGWKLESGGIWQRNKKNTGFGCGDNGTARFASFLDCFISCKTITPASSFEC